MKKNQEASRKIYMREKVVGKIWKVFPWVWTFLGMIYDIWYQIVPGKWILDSDLAAEMVLADHLNRTHSILSKEWFYSSEIRVFESQWFYRIGLLFSPDNWHVARVIAAVILYVAFIAVILFFARGIGLGEYAAWMPAIMMWPFGRWYLVYGLYGTYYLIYMMFSMLMTGVLFRLCRLDQEPASKSAEYERKQETEQQTGQPNDAYSRRRIWMLCALGLFCAVGSGMNGIKQTMVYFGPLLCTSIVWLFLAGHRRKAQDLKMLWTSCRMECLFAVGSTIFTLANICGYLVNMKILSKIYTFDNYHYMILLDDRACRLYDIFMDFLRLFGYEGDVGALSFRGIASILGLGFAAVFVICLFRLCVRYSELPAAAQIVVWVFGFSMGLDGIAYCLMGYYKQYYWLPMLPFAIAVILLELRTENFFMRGFRQAALCAIALILPVVSWGTVKQETENPLFTTSGYRELTDYLLDSGLTEGYASFWSSAVLREMSSDRIQTWTLYNVSENFVKYGWLQEKEKKETNPEGRCFLIVNEVWDGKAEKSALIKYGSGELIYEDGPIKVYEFESPSKIQEAADEFRRNL